VGPLTRLADEVGASTAAGAAVQAALRQMGLGYLGSRGGGSFVGGGRGGPAAARAAERPEPNVPDADC
jgi:hypothetical protein